jgi:hypothetical protein
MIPGLNEQEALELATLLEEAGMSNYERRHHRMAAAEERLKRLGIANPIARAENKDRCKSGPLSDDEFVLAHHGFTRAEYEGNELDWQLEEIMKRKRQVSG